MSHTQRLYDAADYSLVGTLSPKAQATFAEFGITDCLNAHEANEFGGACNVRGARNVRAAIAAAEELLQANERQLDRSPTNNRTLPHANT